MAKRRKTTRRKRAIRRNPSRRTTRRIVRRAGSGFRGINVRTALHSVPLRVLGMFVAKWAAKRGTPNALEADPSTWNGMTYLKGGLGAYAGAVVANMIKPGTGQRILEGGITLLIYKAVQNHLIPKNNWLTGQFGFGAEGGGYAPGQVEVNSEGEPFIMGQDGQWQPMDDTPGLMGFSDYGDYGDYGEDDWTTMGQNALEPPGPLGFADVLEPPGRLGGGQDAAYARALLNR